MSLMKDLDYEGALIKDAIFSVYEVRAKKENDQWGMIIYGNYRADKARKPLNGQPVIYTANDVDPSKVSIPDAYEHLKTLEDFADAGDA